MTGSDSKIKNNGFQIEISKFTDRPFSPNFLFSLRKYILYMYNSNII